MKVGVYPAHQKYAAVGSAQHCARKKIASPNFAQVIFLHTALASCARKKHLPLCRVISGGYVTPIPRKNAGRWMCAQCCPRKKKGEIYLQWFGIVCFLTYFIYGMGRCANSLKLGCDCKGHVHYWDATICGMRHQFFFLHHSIMLLTVIYCAWLFAKFAKEAKETQKIQERA